MAPHERERAQLPQRQAAPPLGRHTALSQVTITRPLTSNAPTSGAAAAARTPYVPTPSARISTADGRGSNSDAAAPANRNQERSVAFRPLDAGSITLDAEVSVMIVHADPVVASGLAAVLHEHTVFQIVPTPAPGNFVYGPPPAEVVLADHETAMYIAERAPQWSRNLVIFTNHASEAKISRALESGARGYLLYGIGLPELFEGIRSVHGGGVALSPLVAARITSRIKSEALTPRQKAVLEQLMLGLSNKAIASRLNLCVGTVKTHVKSILGKLGADSRTAAVVAAQHRGLLP